LSKADLSLSDLEETNLSNAELLESILNDS